VKLKRGSSGFSQADPSADRRSLAETLQRGVDHGIERCYALGGGPIVRNGPSSVGKAEIKTLSRDSKSRPSMWLSGCMSDK